jgi:hypothetical protein
MRDARSRLEHHAVRFERAGTRQPGGEAGGGFEQERDRIGKVSTGEPVQVGQ